MSPALSVGSYARLTPQVQHSLWVSHTDSQRSEWLSDHLLPPRKCVSRKPDQKQSWPSNPGTPRRRQCLNGHLTARPKRSSPKMFLIFPRLTKLHNLVLHQPDICRIPSLTLSSSLARGKVLRPRRNSSQKNTSTQNWERNS